MKYTHKVSHSLLAFIVQFHWRLRKFIVCNFYHYIFHLSLEKTENRRRRCENIFFSHFIQGREAKFIFENINQFKIIFILSTYPLPVFIVKGINVWNLKYSLRKTNKSRENVKNLRLNKFFLTLSAWSLLLHNFHRHLASKTFFCF